MGSDSETEKSAHKDKKKAFTLSPIAKPLAGKKLSKRALKLVRRGITYLHISLSISSIIFVVLWGYIGLIEFNSILFILLLFFWGGLFVFELAAEKKCLKRGVKEVVKSIRKGNKGLVFIFSSIFFFPFHDYISPVISFFLFIFLMY